jgi:hypothetical protein
MRWKLRPLLWLFVLLFSFCRFASSQDSRNASTVMVEVLDPAGAAVPQAQIKFVESATKNQTTCSADSTGTATCAIAPGSYAATVSVLGFKTSTQGLDAKAGQTQTLRFVLQIQSCPPGSCIEVTGSSAAVAGDTLVMSLIPGEAVSDAAKFVQFKVTFRNLGREDLTFIPGTLVLCGATPSKTSLVKLNLTDEGGKQHRHLPYLGDGPPYQAGCAGQIEFYVVSLHSGESLTLPLDIAKYVDLSDSKQYAGARFPAGNYSLNAELTTEPSEIPENLKTKNVWTGRITSNSVPVPFPTEFMALVDDYTK